MIKGKLLFLILKEADNYADALKENMKQIKQIQEEESAGNKDKFQLGVGETILIQDAQNNALSGS